MRKAHFVLVILFFILIFIAAYYMLRGAYISNVNRERQMQAINDYWKASNYDQVLDKVKLYLEDFPNDSQAMLLQAFAQFNVIFLENTDKTSINIETLWEITSIIRRALVIDPDIAWKREAYYILGKAYYVLSKNNLNKSVEYFDRAKKLGFEASDINDFLIAALKDMGDYDTAEQILHQSIKSNPKFEYYVVLLNMYLERQQNNLIFDTISSAKQYIDSEKEEEILNIIHARNYINIDKLADAEKILREIIESNSKSAEAYFYLGNIYEIQQKMIEARFNWRQAYKLKPTWETVIVKLKGNSFEE